MWLEALRHTLTDSRRALLWWALGLALYAAVILAFYPTVRADPGINEMLQTLPESLRTLFGGDLTSPAGYLTSQLFSLLPLILSVYAALTGAGLIAGAEARGLLEFPLAQPLSRASLLLSRALALLLGLLVIGLSLLVSLWLIGPAFELTVAPGRLLAATALHVLSAWVFGALALALGAATGKPGLAAAVGGGLGTLLLALHTLSAQVPVLRDLGGLNPWTYALGGSPLSEPVGWGPALTFLLVGVGLVLAALPVFRRRDVAY